MIQKLKQNFFLNKKITNNFQITIFTKTFINNASSKL